MLPMLVHAEEMIAMDTHCDSDDPRLAFSSSAAGIVFVIFLIFGAALLMSDPRAHILGALVFLPLLLCPLVHLFIMHRGHRRHSANAAFEKK
jgi:hypothetical protein